MTLTHKEAIDGNIIDDAQAVENLEMDFPILDFLKPKQNFILTMILEQYNSKIKIQLFDYIAKITYNGTLNSIETYKMIDRKAA